MSEIEDYVGSAMQDLTGDPIYSGLLILAFFMALVFMRNFRLDAKIAILFPASVLAMAFIPMLKLIVVFVGTAILYMGYGKLINRT